MKTIIITQARFGSSRLPGKVLKKIGDLTLLDIHLTRLKQSKLADAIMVATTEEPEAKQIVEIAKNNQCLFYQGSTHDVLDRFYQSVHTLRPETVIRVTSDCPLNDGALIDQMIETFNQKNVDYLSNVHPPTFPDGLDIEIFSFSALEKAWKEARSPKEREHVTPYLWENPSLFSNANFVNVENLSDYRMTVDYESDFQLISKLVQQLGPSRPWKDYLINLKDMKKHETHH